MKVRLDAVQIEGTGYLDCRKCHRRSTFPNGAMILIFDYGTIQVVRSANSHAILHQCGQEFFLQCNQCGAEPNITILAKHLKTKRRHILRCVCGGEYKQHQLPVVPHGATEVPAPATPF